mgnify:CR=1 FL=1
MAQFRKDTHQYLGDGKTIFETLMIADQYGNVTGANPSGMAVDAFGRARVSEPYTIFDGFDRFADNGKFNYSNTAGGTYGFISNTSSIDMTLTTTSGASVYRETKKIFAYQPGKSLQVLTTFVMNPSKTNLRQRVGYFGSNNGFFLEQNGTTIQFVKNKHNSGGSKRMPIHKDTVYFYDNPEVVEVLGLSLDQLELAKEKYDLIFMDIEGSEYFALLGMQNILLNSKTLIVEFLPHHLERVAGIDVDKFLEPITPHFQKLTLSGGLTASQNDFGMILKKMYDNGVGDEGIVFEKN